MAPIIFALIPLVFLPFTQDFYETNKWYAVSACAVIVLCVWSIQTIVKKKIALSLGRTFWSLAILAAAGFISLLAASPNKIEAALSPFGPALFASFAILALFSGSDIASHKQKLLTFLSQSISFLGLLALLQVSGLSGKVFSGVAFLGDPLWTPAGSTLGLLSLFVITIPILIDKAWNAHTHKRQAGVFFYGTEVVLLVAAGITTIAIALPKLPSTTLPLWAGWQVMLEALKQFPTTLVGVGPENFIAAFTAGRPAALNMTPIWNTRFLANSSTLLHLGTTTGILGLIAGCFFLFHLAPRSLRNALDWSRLAAALAILMLPPSISVLAVCVVVLFVSETHHHTIHTAKPTAAILTGLVGLGIALGMGYLLIRSYSAEHTFFRAYLTAQKADGGAIQRTGQKAIQLNPYIARYHEAYAQTNLILAAAVAQQTTATQTLTDTDREAITQLISQAIREGKLATQLAPKQVTSWETLARLYQNLIGTADAADTWAIASYQKAIELDPTNPGLRLEMGSIYLAQKNIAAAIAHFAVAAALKPDLANARYNLANAYKENGNLAGAKEELLRTQSLLISGTDDYEKVSAEIAALENEISK